MSYLNWTSHSSLAVALGLLAAAASPAPAQPSYDAATQLGASALIRAASLDAGGNRYVVGNFRGTIDFDPGAGSAELTSAGTHANGFLASFDAAGNYRWALRIGDGVDQVNQCVAVDVDGSGNVVVSGVYTGSFDFDPGAGTRVLGSSGEYVASYTGAGALRWAFQPGYARTNVGRSAWTPSSLAFDAAGNVVVAGSIYGSVDLDPGTATATLTSTKADSRNYSHDIVIASYTTNGTYRWAIRAGSAGYDQAEAVALATNGEIVVTGHFVGTVDFNPSKSIASLTASGAGDAFVARYTSTGSYASAIRLGGTTTTSDRGERVAVASNGDAIVTGWFSGAADFDPGAGTTTLTSSGTTSNLYVARYDGAGALQWAFSPLTRGSADALEIDAAGGLYLSGAYTGANDFDPGSGTVSYAGSGGYIARYDALGVLDWTMALTGSSSGVKTVALLDANGDLSVVGNFSGTVDFDPGTGVASLTSAVPGLDLFFATYTWSILPKLRTVSPTRTHAAPPQLR